MKISLPFNKFKSFDEIPKEGFFLGYGKSYGTKEHLKSEWFIFEYSKFVGKHLTDDGYGLNILEYWCQLPNDIKSIRLNKIQKILENE